MRGSRPVLAVIVALAWCSPAAGPARAQDVTIYRCTDAAGTLTVQTRPCPAGSTQRQQDVRDVPSSPAPPRPALPAPDWSPSMPSMPPIAPEAAAQAAPGAAPEAMRTPQGEFVTTSVGPEPRILDSANLPRTSADQGADGDPDLPPPPPLFRCTTYDNDSYLSEEQEVPPRCLPLRTVGLDGNPAGGAGSACEVVRDQCARVPDGDACDGWRRHAREAETRFRFAHPDNIERRRADYERLAGIVEASCGG